MAAVNKIQHTSLYRPIAFTVCVSIKLPTINDQFYFSIRITGSNEIRISTLNCVVVIIPIFINTPSQKRIIPVDHNLITILTNVASDIRHLHSIFTYTVTLVCWDYDVPLYVSILVYRRCHTIGCCVFNTSHSDRQRVTIINNPRKLDIFLVCYSIYRGNTSVANQYWF